MWNKSGSGLQVPRTQPGAGVPHPRTQETAFFKALPHPPPRQVSSSPARLGKYRSAPQRASRIRWPRGHKPPPHPPVRLWRRVPRPQRQCPRGGVLCGSQTGPCQGILCWRFHLESFTARPWGFRGPGHPGGPGLDFPEGLQGPASLWARRHERAEPLGWTSAQPRMQARTPLSPAPVPRPSQV